MEILGKRIQGISQGDREITLTFDDDTTLIITAKASMRIDDNGKVYVDPYLDLRQRHLKLK